MSECPRSEAGLPGSAHHLELVLGRRGVDIAAASIARTLNLCLLSSRCLTVLGDVHALKGFLSSLHSKLESGSEEMNLNLTLVLSVLFGAPLVIVVSGGTVSGHGPWVEASVAH